MKNLEKAPNRRLVQRYNAILRQFDRASRGDPYGWDWPTMNVLYPELVAEAREIRAEAKKRRENGRWPVSTVETATAGGVS